MMKLNVLFIAALCASPAMAQDKVNLGSYALDRTEVTIGMFRKYALEKSMKTAAEREGGGFEYVGGWVRRQGWTWQAPQGQPSSDNEPVTHVSWSEARDYCSSVGGRLPTIAEWRRAAYTETRQDPTDGFQFGRTYAYPVGDKPEGMNINGKQHVPAGTTARGVNGLYDMGANVWEWIADRRGEEALTAGGSWWYGATQTRSEGAQWKPAAFYAVYVGFRCAYDLRS